MSARVRGQEAIIEVVVDGQTQGGSFVKVKDFTLTPRLDLVEESYLGEVFDDLDNQLHGYDFSFTVDEEDGSTIEFHDLVAANEESTIAPPQISLAVTTNYREAGLTPKTMVLSEIVMKVSEFSYGGRKEFVSTSIEGKAKRMIVQ